MATLLAGTLAGEPPKRTIVATFAHPDDEVFIGPLLSRYAREGADVFVVMATNGETGVTHAMKISAGAELAKTRQEEGRCSCRQLGIRPPIFLEFPDGELGQKGGVNLNRMEGWLRSIFLEKKPDVVITWGPEGLYGHIDHRLVGDMVTQVIQTGGGGITSRLLYVGIPAVGSVPREGPDFIRTDKKFLTVRIPFSPADLEASRRAWECYKSQYTPAGVEKLMRVMTANWNGEVSLRPWFGDTSGNDLFEPDGNSPKKRGPQPPKRAIAKDDQ